MQNRLHGTSNIIMKIASSKVPSFMISFVPVQDVTRKRKGNFIIIVAKCGKILIVSMATKIMRRKFEIYINFMNMKAVSPCGLIYYTKVSKQLTYNTRK